MVRVWEKTKQWVRLTVLVVMNSFKPIMNTQLMRWKKRLGPKSDWDLMCADPAKTAGNKVSSRWRVRGGWHRKAKRDIGTEISTQKASFVNNLAFTAQKHCFLVSWTSKPNPVMTAIIRSSVMTVIARKILKRQVVLMVGKRCCTVRYAGEGEGGLAEKTRALGGVAYAHKTERTLREKGIRKQKCTKNFK